MGACLFAAQPFHCAVTYFGGNDPLVYNLGANRHAVPHCYDCPNSDWYTLVYDHCKLFPDTIDISKLADYVRRDCYCSDNMLNPKHRVYLYNAKNDKSYKPGVVESVQGLYAQLLPHPSMQIRMNNTVLLKHTWPADKFYLIPGFDAVEQCLETVFPNRVKRAQSKFVTSAFHSGMSTTQRVFGRGDFQSSNLFSFSQKPFHTASDKWLGLGHKAWVYAPRQCQAHNGISSKKWDSSQSDTSKACAVLFWFNSCGGGGVRYDRSDFEGWAETLGIVIVTPTVRKNQCQKREGGCGGSVLRGCWDVYGQLGPDYAKRTGPHMDFAGTIIDEVLKKATVSQ